MQHDQVRLPQIPAEHLAQLEKWLASYRPDALFDAGGTLIPELAALAPAGDRRMGANPHANGGLLLRDRSAGQAPSGRFVSSSLSDGSPPARCRSRRMVMAYAPGLTPG
ncbi:MAG TPA: hypothetical protein VGX23_22790 [Actinocrinis sp.]|nr:hypothetical protein [Actinocrinis sp.]